MDEKAIDLLYKRAKSEGYTKSVDEFVVLLHNNNEAFNLMYSYAKDNGYQKDEDSFAELVGKKKSSAQPKQKSVFSQPFIPNTAAQNQPGPVRTPAPSTTASSSAVGSSASSKEPAPVQTKTPRPTASSSSTSPKESKFDPKEIMQRQPTPVASSTNIAKPKSQFVDSKKPIFVNKPLDSEIKAAELAFEKQAVKPNVGQSAYMKERLSVINEDLINKSEEYVVPEMEYQFGELGFTFEETGAGDYMNVTAPDGVTKIKISLGKRAKLDRNQGLQEIKKLQDFLTANTPKKGLFVLEQTMMSQDKKFNSQKQVDDEVQKINQSATDLNLKQKSFLVEKSKYEAEVAALQSSVNDQTVPEEYNKKVAELEKKRLALNNQFNTIIAEEDIIKSNNIKLEQAVGKYTRSKAKQGTWVGAIGNAILTGFDKISAFTASTFMSGMVEVLPTGVFLDPQSIRDATIQKSEKLGVAPPAANQSMEDWKKTLTPEQLDDWEDEMDDFSKKAWKKSVMPSMRVAYKTAIGDKNTTVEFENLKKSNFWGGAILGLAESLPSMIGGAGKVGWAIRTSKMFAQVGEGLAQEMENDPDFADISENEKLLITLPIGIVGAVLENVGLKNLLASKGIINSIVMSALGKTGRKFSAKTFRELVENEVDNRILKGTLVLAAGGLAEGETGALQEVSETGFKAIYNLMKGKEMFDTPDTAMDFIENIAVAGASEMVGGFVMSVPTSVSAAYSKKGFLKMDDASFQAFENMANDESMQSAYISKLKQRITEGSITPKDAKEELNNYRNSVGLFRQLPDGLNTKQKKEAMNLLKEKKELEQFIQGKDAALVTRQKSRIEAINTELVAISEKEGTDTAAEGELSSPVAESAEVAKQREDRIAELGYLLSPENPVAYTINKRTELEAELENLKTEQNAIQEQAASQVPLQSEAGVSGEVAQGVAQAGTEVVTQEGQAKEEVGDKPIEVGDKVLDSNGVEYEVVGLVTSRKGTQQAEVKIPKRTDAQIQEDAKRNVFNRNENRLLYKDSNDPKFIKEQSIAISQEISDQTAVNNSSQGSTTLDLADLKKSKPQVLTQEQQTAEKDLAVNAFPKTKTQRIVYHGTTKTEAEWENSADSEMGVAFGSKEYAENYIKGKKNGRIISAVVDVQNPETEKGLPNYASLDASKTPRQRVLDAGYDSVVSTETTGGLTEEVVVFNKNQIKVLSTDISKEQTQPSEQQTTESVLDKPIEEVSVEDIIAELNRIKNPLSSADISVAELNSEGDVLDFIRRANAVLKFLYPKATFEVYNTTKEYEAAGGRRNSLGEAMMNENGEHRILLDLENIKKLKSAKTAFHEVIHPIVYDAFGTSPEKLIPIWNEIFRTMRNVKGMERVFRHVQMYPTNEIAVEGITETITQIAAGNIDLSSVPKSQANKFIELINKLFEALKIDFRINSINDFSEVAKKVKQAFDSSNAESLKGIIKGGKNIDNYYKKLKNRDINPEMVKKLEKLLQEKLKIEVEAGRLKQENANKILKDNNIANVKQAQEGQQAAEGSAVSSKTIVNIAPFFDTKVETVEDANELRKSPEYQSYKQTLTKLAKQLGIPNIVINDVIGGYENESGDKIVEISNQVIFDGATIEQAEEFAAMIAALTPEVQEASIAARYVNEGDPEHNANEYRVKVGNINLAIKALKGAGITNFSVNEDESIVTFTDVFDFADKQLQDKIGRFVELLEQSNTSYEKQQFRPTQSKYVDKGKRKEILRRIKSDGSRPESRGEGFGETVEQAIQRDAEFQGTTAEEYSGVEPKKPVAGNRLFNKPLKAVTEIANRYYERVFGTKRPEYYGSRGLDEELAKQISDAYENLVNDPFNPEVRAAYEALAKEVIEQFKAFSEAGFSVEIDNDEPYANSQEMIEDLRNNNRIKIFSTESGFGDTPITEEQRNENPLLAKTEYTDINGVPLLVNDLFRAVHDFFGHAELGNSFGQKGEENAWNIHVRMFSPLAARAMTTETRGQNSFVNSSGINEAVEPLRKQARQLRKEGKTEELNAVVAKIYEIMKFADQKVGLLPEKFSRFDVNDIGDESMKKVNAPSESSSPGLDLDADTSNPDVLDKILNVLDNVDKALSKGLFSGPNSVTTAIPLGTMQVIVKALKTLVKGGMTLRDAIKKVAADNNVKEQDVISSLTIISNMENNISEGLSEAELPGYDIMMTKVDGIIKKVLQKAGRTKLSAYNSALNYLQQASAYGKATNIQQEAMVRQLRKQLGIKEKAAPSVSKVLGKTKTKVTVDEMAALKSQIKLEARAAREAKGDLNTKRRMLTDAVRKMASSGTLSAKKVAAIINKIGKLNLDSYKSVQAFIDYAGKVFADAEYADKLSAANKIRSQIRKLSKNKDKFANLRELGSKFVDIDPSMVEDIDQYNSMASVIRDSIKGSTTRGTEPRLVEMVRESDAAEYINNTMEAQQKALYKMKLDEVQELLGVDASDLSYAQILELLEGEESLSKKDDSLLRAALNKAFSIYSTLIKESIRTGKDLFTGEDVEYTENQKKVIGEFMDMDLNFLGQKQALEAVDALMNFLQNQSTAKMDSVLGKYKGEAGMREMETKGLKAKPIRKYFSKNIGKLLIEQTANLNILFERMFGGFNKAGAFMKAMGISDLILGKSKALRESNNVVKEYVDTFYKRKPNGEAFNTAFNNVERGMVAWMVRGVIGTDAEIQEEFNRRKKLIEESIAELEKGNEKEVALAEVYKKVFENLKDAKNAEEVKAKANKDNVEAVEFWQSKWSDKYEQLSDVALGVYNKVLGKDTNYTTDTFSKLSRDPGEIDLTAEDMGFLVNSGNAPLYKKSTGVLMESTRPKSLPKNTETKKPNRYVNLSFDSNMSNSFYDALVDINTAAPIRQVQSALNSDSFARMVKDKDDVELVRNRINMYVNNIRKKSPYSNDQLSKAVRGLNRIAAIGVGQALGGVLQPFKQVIPIAMNTIINAGGLDVQSVFNKAKQDFINRSGYGISNRGVESQAQTETLNKMINQAANGVPEKAFRAIEYINNLWLKNLLVRFDVVIARASWMTYYEQSLRKQGIDPTTINYNTVEVNETAADYAQRQVDRQQNVSDADLAGALMSSKNPTTQIINKVVMPFASFRMNQSARLGADLSTLTNSTSTVEDKVIAIRSLTGFAAEMVTFRAISVGSSALIGYFVKGLMDREDDEEKDKKKKDAIIKGQLTSTVSDVFSPAPLFDEAIGWGVSAILESTQDALDIDKKERVSIYSGKKEDFFQSLGTLGISASRIAQIYEMVRLSSGKPFEDNYGRDKYLSKKDQETLASGPIISMAILSNLGLVPSEVNSVIRSSINDAKRNASTKVGGKSEQDLLLDKKDKEAAAENKIKKEEKTQKKIKALEQIKKELINSDESITNEIQRQIDLLSMSPEQKKAYDEDEKNREAKQLKEEEYEALLQGYENQTEMKNADKDLWEKTFGPESPYSKENYAERMIKRMLEKKMYPKKKKGWD